LLYKSYFHVSENTMPFTKVNEYSHRACKWREEALDMVQTFVTVISSCSPTRMMRSKVSCKAWNFFIPKGKPILSEQRLRNNTHTSPRMHIFYCLGGSGLSPGTVYTALNHSMVQEFILLRSAAYYQSKNESVSALCNFVCVSKSDIVL
jgi:hypothetical protein